MFDDITPEIAANTLAYFRGDEGYAAGGYFTLIYEAAACADEENFQFLSRIYPARMKAFRMVQRERDGLEKMRALMNRDRS